MRSSPSGSTPYVVASTITRQEFETMIARESDEIAAAFDALGRPTLPARRGGPFCVPFSLEESDRLEDAVVTHSHPLGGLLSGEDAAFAADFDLAEIRAVLPDGVVYSLLRPGGGWPDGAIMLAAAKRCLLAVFRERNRRLEANTPKMSRREENEFMLNDRCNAFREIGVELERTSIWQ